MMQLNQNSMLKIAKDQLHVIDPEPILKALNISYITVNPTSYKLNLRGERQASAFITFLNGKWQFKDFGSNDGGTIENIVMLTKKQNYKNALSYCLTYFNLDHKLNQENSYLDFIQEPMIQKSTIKSKVLYVREPYQNSDAVTYLKERGILKIPPQFKLINGEYYKNNEAKKVFGIGILNQSDGADIHFLKQVGNLKTMNLGNKNISFFKNKNTDKVAIFESKMDYAAAYQHVDLTSSNIIIANSTSNLHKVTALLKEYSFQVATFFQQNDQQGRNFARKIVQEANLLKFNYIQYQPDEECQDINDLLLNNQNIQDRITSYCQHANHNKHKCRS